MRRLSPFALLAASLLLCSAAQPPLDDDYPIQGEYAAEGQGIQVVAMGGGTFMAARYTGGLPGAGGIKASRKAVEATLASGALQFAWPDGVQASLANGALSLVPAQGQAAVTLPKVNRQSPTLGMAPPPGAVVLFDGTSADAFVNGRIEDGLLCEGVNSKASFGSHTLHVEFRLPYLPRQRGQGRGNSGVYLQGRYETQVLDSFGLEGKNNECGGIYSVRDPDHNMCLPPMVWQTYDTDFTAATFDASGKKTANARMTVRLNGVVVHDNVEVPHKTTAAPVNEGPEPSYLHLQNHGNPVRYRNIWVLPKN